MQKRFIPVLIGVAVIVMTTHGFLWGQDSRSKWLKDGGSKPIEIVSDRLDAYKEKDLVQFSGHVVATQGDRVIKSDTLMLYFAKKEEGRPAAGDAAPKAGDIDRIVAKGNVRITEKDRIVTGEQAVFTNADQRIVVTVRVADLESICQTPALAAAAMPFWKELAAASVPYHWRM